VNKFATAGMIPASLYPMLRADGVPLPRVKPTPEDEDKPFPVLDDQQQAVVEMKACQIHQTKYKGPKQRADEDELLWAELCDTERRRIEEANRIPGTCRGCNSNPCRCLA
jgi:hypothetical protein